jgi:glycosyltransferase involved in cell wall biosynthesis
MGVPASAIGKKYNITKLITYHTPGEHYTNYVPRFLPIRYKTVVDLLEKIVYNSFNVMLTPCAAVRRDLVKRGFSAHKLFVLPNCVDVEMNHRWISEERIQSLRDRFELNGKKIITYVGRMSPEKHIPEILQLIPGIIKEEPNTHFLMVGKGPYLEQYRTLGRKLAPKDVTFTGYVSNADLSNLLQMSNMGVIFVGGAQVFDITLLNYWTNNLAVCARQAGGMVDVIDHEENGMLFNQTSQAYDQILAVLQDERLCRRLAQKGYETVKKQYNVDVVTRKMLKYYKLAADRFHVRGDGIVKHMLKFFRRKRGSEF